MMSRKLIAILQKIGIAAGIVIIMILIIINIMNWI